MPWIGESFFFFVLLFFFFSLRPSFPVGGANRDDILEFHRKIISKEFTRKQEKLGKNPVIGKRKGTERVGGPSDFVGR